MFLKFFVFVSVFAIGAHGFDLVDLLDIAMFSGEEPCGGTPPCSGKGECNAEQMCVCEEGFTGLTCETEINSPCYAPDCPVNSNCTEVEGGAKCVCHEGYVGDFCIQDPCIDQDCNGQGNCTADCSTEIAECNFNCACNDNWSGSICSLQNYCSTEGACNGDPCEPGAGANDFTCNCTSGNSGTICDIPVCGANGGYPATPVGAVVSSNTTCEEGPYVGISNASRKCELNSTGAAVWQDEKVIDCSIALNETTDPAEISQILEVVTSDPTQIQADDVSTYVTAISDVCDTTNVTAEVGDSVVTSINNMMSAPADTQSSVVSQSQQILGDLQNLADNVAVPPTYNTVDPLLGLVVVEGTTGSTTGRSLSILKLLFQEDGFSGVTLEPSNDASAATGTNYIATTATDEKIAFQVFNDDLLFPDSNSHPEEIINSIIFSVNRSGDVTLKFQLFQHYDLNKEGMLENETHTTTATCVQYVDNSWIDAKCISLVTFEGSNNFLMSNCSGAAGTFAVKMIVLQKASDTTVAPEDTTKEEGGGGGGLSTPELVGIVVGSIAGVALIIGIGYGIYTSCKKKKKEPTKVTPIKPTEQINLKDVEETEAQKEESRPSSRNAW